MSDANGGERRVLLEQEAADAPEPTGGALT